MKNGTKNNAIISRANLFECLAIAKGKPKTEAATYLNMWGKNYLSFEDELAFGLRFGYRLQVWKIEEHREHNRGIRIFGNRGENVLRVLVDDSWDINSEKITIHDRTSYVHDPKIFNYFECEELSCSFVARSVQRLKDHHDAHRKDRVKCGLQTFGCEALVLDQMKEEGILPLSFREIHGVFWDVESLLIPSDRGLNHVPITIALYKNFGDEPVRFIRRDDMTPSSLKKMICQFVDVLDNYFNEFQSIMPEIVYKNMKHLSFLVYKHDQGIQTVCPNVVSRYKRFLTKLKDICCLKLFAFRGERTVFLIGPT